MSATASARLISRPSTKRFADEGKSDEPPLYYPQDHNQVKNLSGRNVNNIGELEKKVDTFKSGIDIEGESKLNADLSRYENEELQSYYGLTSTQIQDFFYQWGFIQQPRPESNFLQSFIEWANVAENPTNANKISNISTNLIIRQHQLLYAIIHLSVIKDLNEPTTRFLNMIIEEGITTYFPGVRFIQKPGNTLNYDFAPPEEGKIDYNDAILAAIIKTFCCTGTNILIIIIFIY